MDLTEVLIICNIVLSFLTALIGALKIFKKSSCVSTKPDGSKKVVTLEMSQDHA